MGYTYTAIPGKPKWVDLSSQHAIARKELENRLRNFFADNAVSPLAIVGAFGSGKSELMSVGYRMAWENAFPAFWLNLEDLLSVIPSGLTPKEFTEWLNQKIVEQIQILGNCFVEGDRLGELFVPHPLDVQTAREYFAWLGIPIEQAVSAATKKRAILFLDEMEAHYTDLLAKVPSDDRAPLRVLQQAVEQKGTCFLLVMSFGLASAYEALSGAEARRRGFLPVPLPRPRELAKSLLNTDELANFMWWSSRGRPGWALPLWDSWKAFLADWMKMPFEQVHELLSKTPNIEGLPVVNWKAVSGISASSLEVLKQVLLALGPIDPVTNTMNEMDELEQHFYIGAAQELMPISELEDALTSDIVKLAKEYAPASGEVVSEIKLREYVRKVLQSISTNDQICFGGWKSETDAFVKGWLGPLITLFHDFVLEFEGDTEDGTIIVDCLYRMGASWDVFSGQVKDPWLVANKFSKTKTKFKAYGGTEAHYIQATPKLIEEMFPRLVVKPALRLSDKAESDISQQRSILKGAVGTSGQFLTAVVCDGGMNVEFILLPSAELCSRLQQSLLQQIHRNEYLPYEHVFVILNLDEGLQEPNLDPGQNSDVVILSDLGKLSIEPLKERRLQDFFVSLWYNSNVLGKGSPELFRLIDEVPTVVRLSKASRRTIDHYKTLAAQTLRGLATQVITRYLDQIRQVFPLDDSEFPGGRVKSLINKIRDDRTTDSVAAAVGVYYSKVASLNLLGRIRDLVQLRDFSKGFKEFLEDYSVIKEKGSYGPSASMRDILDYLDQRSGFAKLLEDILPKLAYTTSEGGWGSLTEDLTETPLDQMFATLSNDRRIFLKALYMTSLLSAHKQQLCQDVARLKARISTTAQQYEALAGQIKNFNDELKVKILSDSECKSIGQQLNTLSSVLDDVDSVHAASAYVIYRVAKAIQEGAQDKRDNWAGEKGLQGWIERLRVVLELSQHVEECERELEQAFSKHTSIKTDALGNRNMILNQKVNKPLLDSVDSVMQALGSVPYELADGIPVDRIDVGAVKETLISVKEEVDSVCAVASEIDAFVDAVGELSNGIIAFGSQMTKGGEGESRHTVAKRKKRSS